MRANITLFENVALVALVQWDKEIKKLSFILEATFILDKQMFTHKKKKKKKEGYLIIFWLLRNARRASAKLIIC